MESSHVIVIEKGRILCPIDRGNILRSYFTLLRQDGRSSQIVTEWRFVLFLPYWHADYMATLLESDEPVFGDIHRLTMVVAHTPRASTVAIGERNENGYVVEVVDCEIKEFLPSNQYTLAAEALKSVLDTIAH